MDFVYEEVAASEKKEVKVNSTDHDDKTEEAFEKFEQHVDKQYQRTTDAIKKFLGDDEYIEMNLPLNPKLTEKAQDLLKKLDTNLQTVEHAAQCYWGQISQKSFWSTMTDSLTSGLSNVANIMDDNIINPQHNNSSLSKNDDIAAAAAAAGNRTESQLKQLSSDKNIYLDNQDKLPSDFSVGKHTDEISTILKNDLELSTLMSTIVPEKITYRDFWATYFTKRDNVLEMEKNRKELLENLDSDDRMKPEVAWDDEDGDDEEEAIEIVGSEDGIEEPLNLRSANGSSQNLASDEDDDEWE
ncbi:Dos2p Ecym_6185 [Eremothecium cymbalariae DBVPG|uniref:BSD domain-containing protein n=1 Tax=Eremothecium cymbalariae (strain CBS 270.75 / DBVPG 7215 / KCTC 17166 / NRRL Y-17582) TaxID=931890 RepID=G8JV89_ERECY|nr:hypothetical protein Ecym_6185 [Eremothecium cymbalariae DBVPG\